MSLQCLWHDSVTLIKTSLLTYLLTPHFSCSKKLIQDTCALTDSNVCTERVDRGGAVKTACLYSYGLNTRSVEVRVCLFGQIMNRIWVNDYFSKLKRSLPNHFCNRTGTLRCLQKEMATYRHWSVSLWRDPDDVPHCRILSPDKTECRLISATLCRWRRCFVADQLWLMTHIREEEVN